MNYVSSCTHMIASNLSSVYFTIEYDLAASFKF